MEKCSQKYLIEHKGLEFALKTYSEVNDFSTDVSKRKESKIKMFFKSFLWLGMEGVHCLRCGCN